MDYRNDNCLTETKTETTIKQKEYNLAGSYG